MRRYGGILIIRSNASVRSRPTDHHRLTHPRDRCYLVMFAMIFDYSRWISNWAVCLFLILHAVKTLPAFKDAPPISADDRKTFAFGWFVTLIPRVGVVRPF